MLYVPCPSPHVVKCDRGFRIEWCSYITNTHHKVEYILLLTNQTREFDPLMVQCWLTVCDSGPTCVYASSLLCVFFVQTTVLGLPAVRCVVISRTGNVHVCASRWELNVWQKNRWSTKPRGVLMSSVSSFIFLRKKVTSENWSILLSKTACRWVFILFNWNSHPLEVSENYADLTKWKFTIFKSCWFMSRLILNAFKRW